MSGPVPALSSGDDRVKVRPTMWLLAELGTGYRRPRHSLASDEGGGDDESGMVGAVSCAHLLVLVVNAAVLGSFRSRAMKLGRNHQLASACRR